jgi:hypothetical protein
LRGEKVFEKVRQTHLQEKETLKKSQEKNKSRHDQQRIKKSLKVGGRVWLQLNKEILYGHGKNIEAMWYFPFEIF